MLQILLFWKHVFDFHSKGADANPIIWEEATFEIDSDLSLAAGFDNGKWWQLGFHWSQLSHHTWTSRFCLDFTGFWWISFDFTSICLVGLDFYGFDDWFGSSIGCHWSIEHKVFIKIDVCSCPRHKSGYIFIIGHNLCCWQDMYLSNLFNIFV